MKDESKGAEPIRSMYDVVGDTFSFIIDGETHKFLARDLPFTLVEIDKNTYADKALILKHAERL